MFECLCVMQNCIRMSASVCVCEIERETETRRQTGQHDRQLPFMLPPSSQTLARPWTPRIKVDPTNAKCYSVSLRLNLTLVQLFKMLLLLAVAISVVAAVPEAGLRQDDRGLEFSLPHVPGTKKVQFDYVVEVRDGKSKHRTGTASKQENDSSWRWRDENVKLNNGDKVLYTVSLWTGKDKYEGSLQTWKYELLPTLGPRRTRAVVFRDDFNGASLDRNHWKYEVSMFGGMNWEFQVYTPEHANVFLEGGHLFLKPTPTVNDARFDENFLTSGTMDMTAIWGECTNSGNYGCSREGRYGMLPPIMSGKVTTIPTIRFGQVEVRARIPVGDWIWPAIWMMPRDSVYGTWPRSGEIDIMESRGNLNARDGGVNHGVNEVSSTLHWGTAWDHNNYALTHGEVRKSSGGYQTDFHTWRLDWTHDHIVTSVDGQEVLRVTPPGGGFTELGHVSGSPWPANNKMAPFDQDFFLILNVAVGGTNGYFPDGWNYGVTKPWPNNSPHANADFWAKRNEWESTWQGNNAAMEIDYIELRSL